EIFVRCIFDFVRSILNPFRAEILVAREALSWIRLLYVDYILLEANCQ
ncbi:hypothetical protein Goshw_003580, partial [Gossypium schwendimanii]|nr:hypothetical protein [Gossypium schwendimanii]